MKKTYITPNTCTVRVNVENIIAGSPISFSDESSGSGFLNDEEADEYLVKGSRGSDDWDW